MLKENVILISFFITIIAFIVSMNLQWHYTSRLNYLFKRKYPLLHKKLILIDFGYALFIPKPIKLMKYVWSEKKYSSDIYIIIKKIRTFQKLGLFFFILTILMPFIIELAFGIF